MKWCIKAFLKLLHFVSWLLFVYIIVTYKKENVVYFISASIMALTLNPLPDRLA